MLSFLMIFLVVKRISLSAHFYEFFFLFQVKEFLHPTSNDVSLLFGLTRVSDCLRYIPLLALWDIQYNPKENVLYGL